jgi:F0F1-type ATP synthase membrane subunit b/b'
MKPIVNALKEREKGIEEALHQAEKARQKFRNWWLKMFS